VLVAYPVAMGLALVYLGEHYVFDLAVGMLYAIIA
jgi:membrane-associated phospholipid phosphatase